MLVGVRINIKNAYKNGVNKVDNDRFGFTDESLKDFISEFDDNRFSFIMLHYHQRSEHYDENKALCNIEHVFKNYYVSLKTQFPTLSVFNIGGGVPVCANGKINYQLYADNIIKLFSRLCCENNVEQPYIMQENGKYTVANSCAYIYEVINEKTINNVVWYTVNGSFISTIPNSWAIDANFKFLQFHKVLINAYTFAICNGKSKKFEAFCDILFTMKRSVL